jgi:ribosome recycling factor
LIQPYDQTSIPVIEKAIVASDLGITPANDGRVIRLSVPPLTADRRKEMGKTVSKLGEEGKVAVRNVRKAAMKAVDGLLKAGSVSEDRHKALGKAVQDLTDAHVKEVDELVKKKQAELAMV